MKLKEKGEYYFWDFVANLLSMINEMRIRLILGRPIKSVRKAKLPPRGKTKETIDL